MPPLPFLSLSLSLQTRPPTNPRVCISILTAYVCRVWHLHPRAVCCYKPTDPGADPPSPGGRFVSQEDRTSPFSVVKICHNGEEEEDDETLQRVPRAKITQTLPRGWVQFVSGRGSEFESIFGWTGPLTTLFRNLALGCEATDLVQKKERLVINRSDLAHRAVEAPSSKAPSDPLHDTWRPVHSLRNIFRINGRTRLPYKKTKKKCL